MSDYTRIIEPGLSIGLLDADLLDGGTRHPNLVLMKLSGYALEHGCKTELLESYEDIPRYDYVFVACVFTFTDVPVDLDRFPNVFYGGTGFFPDGGESLPCAIEHHMPDYHLYDPYVEKRIAAGRKRSWFADYLDYSIGFLSRGCFRKCSFCVNKKYDRAFLHSPLREFLDESRPKIYLWDDNFLACPGWEQALDELVASGKPFQFRQGLDVRLLNEKRAARLSKVNYCGDFIFAFDHVEDKELIESRLALWRKHTERGTRLYVLCAYDSQDEKDIESVFIRIKVLMRYGCLPYIMRYEAYKESRWRSLYVNIARWCNQPQFFKKKSFRAFCEANQQYHKNKDTQCAAYRSMLDFESAYPEIAAEYFDMRYEDENMLLRYGRPFNNRPTPEVDENLRIEWQRVREGLPVSELLALYLGKRIDTVWLDISDAPDAEELAESLFDVIRDAGFDELFQAVCDCAKVEPITSENIPQFSSVDDVCRVPGILSNLEEPLGYDALGIYLHPDERKVKTAHKKYGENHGKMATLLDLAFLRSDTHGKAFVPAPFSGMFERLPLDGQAVMAAKLSLRIPIVQRALCDARSGEVHVLDYMTMLAESTKRRRLSNVISVFKLIGAHLSEDDSALRAALGNVMP